ncbi:hypothetical protein HJC23_002963 [Cyclotella cryptica]|uniref:Uncharacterized protein n=1 Tax=Cyclotella cryptica TaxID=29204 RepID=A0ABD3PGM3_9STRA|eukprot:CCRYP_015251-RA/>CCRYP_015251-RA protein AED:0.19 eAED:0.19 QI:0/-1/0/1/-1/1/1/0/578
MRGSPFILVGLLYYWVVATYASSSSIAGSDEQYLRGRGWESTLDKILCLSWLPGLMARLPPNVRNRDSLRRENQQTEQPQYVNWKTKRKNSDILNLRNERYLEEEDDEVLFDSNGMPIQLDDDHDAFNVGDEENAVNTVDVGDKLNPLNAPPAEKQAEDNSAQSIKPDPSHKTKNPNDHKPKKIQSNSNPVSQTDTLASASAGNHRTENKADLNNAAFIKEDQETTKKKSSVTHNTKLFNNTHHNSTNDSPPADTIFDDILRGFSFAFIFCICIICLHKTCRYACIRCGILPDDRVVEARWRRLQLKNKRAYFNPHAPPLMDTRSLGKWFDQRDRMHPDFYAGIWDSNAERSVGSWDDGSEGDIAFDDDGVQLSVWDKDDASSVAAELEYGEGDELEDKSHDERLFDLEDGGAGMTKEAHKFFDGHAQKNHAAKKKFGQSNNNNNNNVVVPGGLQIETGDVKNDISDDSFFDALEARRADVFDVNVKPDNKANVSSVDSQDFLQRQDNLDNLSSNQALNDDDERGIDEEYDDNIVADDRGYDEESDLLGLRSDSPPPLDLEEIEKKLREEMENAKSYY